MRFAREELKMTANDLAAQVQITPSSLSRSERGVRMLDLDEARRVGSALGMSIEDLIQRAKLLEESGVVDRHEAALQDLARALDAGKLAAQTGAALLRR